MIRKFIGVVSLGLALLFVSTGIVQAACWNCYGGCNGTPVDPITGFCPGISCTVYFPVGCNGCGCTKLMPTSQYCNCL